MRPETEENIPDKTTTKYNKKFISYEML